MVDLSQNFSEFSPNPEQLRSILTSPEGQALVRLLQADGGDLEVVSITGKNVLLRLRGACGACPHAQMTLKDGIERILRESVDPEIVVERA